MTHTPELVREQPGPNRATLRRAGIMRRLRATGFVTVARLAEELAVSDMTIRRDLRMLAADEDVRVVHGGVSLAHATLRTTEFVGRARTCAAEKRAVALRAVSLVREKDVIAIDAGTTAYDIATLLPADFAGTVITHSVPVVQHMLGLPDAHLVCLGGELYPLSQAFTGPATVEQMSTLRVRTFFLGAAAVDERGVYVAADVERATKIAVIEAADRVVLVVDATKFTEAAPIRLCGLDQLSSVVTDRPPPAAVRRRLRQDAVELLLADPAPS